MPSKKARASRPAVKAARSPKQEALEPFREDPEGQLLTTDQGLRIRDDQNSLKAGPRGPSLLEDFILREKITHFDHERIPERVVHARGAAAHGYFQVERSLSRYTRAAFLQDPSKRTPVFVRFSTVAGSRGSSDLARDVRGFAVKFYTEEGNFDLVGNNIPVFFIQDAMIPINRPKCPMRNFQRDGFAQREVPKGQVAYEPNSLAPGAKGIAAFIAAAKQHRIWGREPSLRAP